MSLEQKQQLLIKEIIEKGYNIDAFQNFISKDHTLEDWEYDELEETIKKFQDKQHDYFQVLNCNKTMPNALFNIENVQIKVLGYEKIQKGIFLTTYTYFRIETHPVNWIVKRTYEECIHFRNLLSKQFYVPDIPKQRQSPIEFTYIKQLRHLQMFFNYILSDTELKCLPIIQLFLGNEQFTFNQQVPFSTLSGDVGVRINKQIQNFQKQSDYFLNNTTPLLKKAYKLIKQLMKQFQQQSSILIQLSDIYKQLFRETKAQNQKLKDAYLITQNLFEGWSMVHAEQIKIFTESIYPQQRFQYHLIHPLKEWINLREKSQYQFFEYNQKLKQKKEKLFQQGEIMKWDIDEEYLNSFKIDQIKSTPQIAFQCMCKADNEQLMTLKNQYGRINLRTFELIENIITYASNQTVETLSQLTQKMNSIINDKYLIVWQDAQKNLDQL